MSYGDYLGLSIGRDDFTGPTEESRRQISLRIAARRIEKYGASTDPNAWLGVETAAYRDAEPEDGSYPVVLYAPGFSQPAFDNSIVCELLASHGYIVLAAPSAGQNSQKMTEDLAGVEAQTRDLEFLVAFAHTRPNCDTDHIGAFGWSWGDIAVMLQRMRNPYIDAVISYDGSLEWNYGLARTTTHFDVARMTVPYLYACHGGLDDVTFEFFDSLRNDDTTILRFHSLTHGEFGSYRSELYNTDPSAFQYDTRSYEALCQYTLHFF